MAPERWGSRELMAPVTGPVQVRFSNTGRKQYARAEVHLAYQAGPHDTTQVSFTRRISQARTIPRISPPFEYRLQSPASVRVGS
jgi:hypothetical protein